MKISKLIFEFELTIKIDQRYRADFARTTYRTLLIFTVHLFYWYLLISSFCP